MSYNKLKNIAVSQENYYRLKKLGDAGDSFNDVVTKLIACSESKGNYVVSLGSDLVKGDTNQLHASLVTGEYNNR
jgi:predicted CopG family antitoxin